MSAEVHTRRCARHPDRDAAGFCRGCGGAFCLECLVEHGGRLYCAACLAREMGAAAAGPARAPRVRAAAAAIAGAAALFLLFLGAAHLLGRWWK